MQQMEKSTQQHREPTATGSGEKGDPIFDVLVIGAGAAGLMAALEMAQTGQEVAVIEANERIGGRIFTLQQEKTPFELGAEFIHGNLPLTKSILEKAGVRTVPVAGTLWQYKNGQLQKQEDFLEDYAALAKKFKNINTDKSVADFLAQDLEGHQYEDLRFSLKNYVEGYYAADTEKASTVALCEELTKGDEEQYRVEGSYGLLINYLYRQCRQSKVFFYTGQPVTQLRWQKNEVEVLANGKTYRGKKAVITVPLGVLQQDGIAFSPALPAVKAWAKQLGFGHVVKLVFRFEKAFWKDSSFTGGKHLGNMSFLFSGEAIPTWWTHFPTDDAVLVGWLAGPGAKAEQALTDEAITGKALSALSRLFNMNVVTLQQQVASVHRHNWSADPRSCGAYSYQVVGGAQIIHNLLQPVEGTLFFAGEGLHNGPEIGAVEAALHSGREAARRVIGLLAS